MKQTRFTPTVHRTLLVACILTIQSCHKKDIVPVGSTGSNAMINGQIFNPTKTKATDTGDGIEIALSDASRIVNISLSGKTANTYTVKNTSSGKIHATNDAIISAISDHTVYYGLSGSIILTVGSDGKLSGTFDVELKSNSSQTLTINNGKISDLDIGSVPSGCKIASILAPNPDPANCDDLGASWNFYYNGEGKISKAQSTDGSIYYLYDLDGKLAALSVANAADSYSIELKYSGNTFQSYKVTETGQDGTITDEFVFAYDGSEVSGITRTINNPLFPATSVITYAFGYESGNITTVSDVQTLIYTYSHEYTQSGFDSKLNPFALLAQLSGTPISFLYGGGDDPFKFLSLNNNNLTAKLDSMTNYTFDYAYNSQTYPTQIVYSDSQCVYTIALSYTDCD